MDNSLVYRKSGLGAAQLTADHGRALSPRERQVLVLVNGQRTIAELSDLFGADTIQRLIPDLEAKGFAKRVEPKIGAESGGTVTQLHVASSPRARPSKPARDLRARRYPIVWIGLSLALFLSFAAWTAHRFSNQAAKTKVATQNPPPQAAGDQASLRPLRHDPPRIPPKAQLDGVVEGHARARLWVTAEGKVDQVDIIEETPQGVLDHRDPFAPAFP